MSPQAPYLQRRGDTLFFRIAVPPDLRPLIGWREITKTLRTSKKTHAIPMALEYAAFAKRMFDELRTRVAPVDPEKLRELLRISLPRQRLEAKISVLEENHKNEIDERDRESREKDRNHLVVVRLAKLEAENETMRRFMEPHHAFTKPIPAQVPENATAAPAVASVPLFEEVVNDFLGNYRKRNKPAMLKKHQPVLSMLLEIVGNKPITDIRQADINNFFELLGNLPPRWSDACRQQGLSIRQLANLEHELTIGPKSFDDTYIASVRPFLKAAKKDFQDQGFPLGLTTEGTEYLGDREEGESKQRAFKMEELERLFEGPEMKSFASDKSRQSHYWLPLIGLFTGARVNEICQINPQTDILKDADTGVDYLWVTKETEADSRITKSIKTGDSRKVPIHKDLIELGFLDYIKRVKATGAKLIFPDWEPVNRRASGEAEKWFRQFLRDTNLRDETPHSKILGMHAFRHTLLTHGAMQKPPLSLFCITGHAQEETPILASGAGKGYLTLSMLSPLNDRAAILNQLDYGLNFFKPTAGVMSN